jgi:carboxypeptidase C (cathepsin A)
MKSDPKLRTMVISGYYDLVSSYFAIEQAAGQLAADLARRVTVRTYAGGHAIYTDDTVRHEFRIDGEKFYQARATQ